MKNRLSIGIAVGLAAGIAVGWLLPRAVPQAPDSRTTGKLMPGTSAEFPIGQTLDLKLFLSRYPSIQSELIRQASGMVRAHGDGKIFSTDIERWTAALLEIEKELIVETGVSRRDWRLSILLLRPLGYLLRVREGVLFRRVGPTLAVRALTPLLRSFEAAQIEAAFAALDIKIDRIVYLDTHLATDGLGYESPGR